MTWNDVWKTSQESNISLSPYYPILLAYKNKVTDGKILEAGCGNGDVMRFFDREEIFGIDSSPEGLKKANNGHVVLGDVRYLPFRDKVFKLVTSLGVIEHFNGSELAVREMERTSDGEIFIVVPNKITVYHVYKILKGKKYIFGFEKSYRQNQLKEMITGKIIETGGVGAKEGIGCALGDFGFLRKPLQIMLTCVFLFFSLAGIKNFLDMKIGMFVYIKETMNQDKMSNKEIGSSG